MIKIEGKKFDWFGLTQILKEHKGKLRQIRMLSVNELKKKYKGAALGPLWALINMCRGFIFQNVSLEDRGQ